jgi:RimJ/RimL family protein N-acetyltransferase
MADLLERLLLTPTTEARSFPDSWRTALPVLTGTLATLREFAAVDAPRLAEVLAAPEVARFMSAPPTSADRLAAFAEWGQRERAAGRYAAFALLPRGSDRPVGIVQLRVLDLAGHAAGWGVALGPQHWGAGLFLDAARLVARFAFETVGVHRLEARAAVGNARGQAAMQKLGAVQEGVLRRSLVTADGTHHDQVLWSLLADDWRAARRAEAGERVH